MDIYRVFPQWFVVDGALESRDFRFKSARAWWGVGRPFRAFLSMVQELGEVSISCVFLMRYILFLPFWWIGELIYLRLSDEESDKMCEEFGRLREAQDTRAAEKARRKEGQGALSKAS